MRGIINRPTRHRDAESRWTRSGVGQPTGFVPVDWFAPVGTLSVSASQNNSLSMKFEPVVQVRQATAMDRICVFAKPYAPRLHSGDAGVGAAVDPLATGVRG
jgi:hypothetical protein